MDDDFDGTGHAPVLSWCPVSYESTCSEKPGLEIYAVNIAQLLRNQVNSVKKNHFLPTRLTTPLTALKQLLVWSLSPTSLGDNWLPLEG